MVETQTVRIEVTENLTVVADELGDPAAPGVILSHGGGQSRHSWKGTAAALAEAGWFVLNYDHRGHGDSDWSPEGAYGSPSLSADLRVILERFDRPPAIVGASLGGITLLWAQAQVQADLFSAMVLVDIAPGYDPGGAKRIMDFMLQAPDGFASLDEAADAIAAYNPERDRPADSSGLARVMRQRDDGRWIWRWDPKFLTGDRVPKGDVAFREHLATASRTMYEGARRATVPKLLVRGRQSDLVTPETAQAFLDEVPDCEFVDVAGTGHMVAGDDNDVFTRAVIEFLKRSHPVG